GYGPGRHIACPTGRVVAPPTDEMLLLHYKYLNFWWTSQRHQMLRLGLGRKDVENGWGVQYSYTDREYETEWEMFSRLAIDVRTAKGSSDYFIPRWWDRYRNREKTDADCSRGAGRRSLLEFD